MFWYTLGHDHLLASGTRAIGHFDLGPDPIKMSQLAAGALAFLRFDVRPAVQTVPRSYSREQVLESLRLAGSESPFFTPGFPPALPLIHATRISSLEGPPTISFQAVSTNPIRSDTGELTWHGGGNKRGQVTIQTPRWQALIGFSKENASQTENLAAEIEPSFCALTLSALDDHPIGQANRLLLTATARVANTGMQWDQARRSLASWGTAPARIEVVKGSVWLRRLEGAVRVTIQPLSGAGQPLGAIQEARKTSEGWSVAVGEARTTWYLIHVVR